MRSSLSAFFKQAPALPRPAQPVWFIGDIHGRLDLLRRMLNRLAADDGARIVVLGDMIDRGPDTAGVLELLATRQRRAPDRIICLMGNHERMLLEALDSPTRNAPHWLNHGGAETVQSFGLRPFAQDPEKLAQELRAALPKGTEAWLRALPLMWHEGPIVAAHAGIDPDLPLTAQPEDTLLWGHRAYGRKPHKDGLWVVHGHRIVPQPQVRHGRIAVDTGAWQTGRLSAARLGPDELRLIEIT